MRGRALGSLKYAPAKIKTSEDGPTFRTAGDVRNYVVDGGGWELDQGTPHEMTPRLILAAAKQFWKAMPNEDKELWEERIGGTLPDRLIRLNNRWLVRWAEDIKNEEPLGVEVKWTAPLPGTETEVHEDGVEMTGYVDEVYRDKRRGLVVVRDHKSTRNIGTTTTADDLMDSQLHIYAYGINPLVKSWGEPGVAAIAYDRVRTQAPKIPAVTQAGGLSKSITDYDLQTYLDWAAGPDGEGVPYPGRKKDGSDAGLYRVDDYVVEKLSSPTAQSIWHQRTLVPLNMNVVKTHMKSAADTQRETDRTLERFWAEGDAARNFTRKGCQWCDYADLCRAEMIGGPGGTYPPADYGLKNREGFK